MNNNIKKVNTFLNRLINVMELSNVNISSIENIGGNLLQNEDMIQTSFKFRKNNAIRSSFELFVPVVESKKIFTSIEHKEFTQIDSYVEYCMTILKQAIILIFNRHNPRNYIIDDKNNINNSSFITNNVYRKNLYKVNFELSGSSYFIYIDISDIKNLV